MAKIKAAIQEHRADPRLVDERGPTPERANKLRPSPLNLALVGNPPNLTREQGVAAEKFYAHWFRAGLAENFGSADLNRIFGGDGGGAGMARTEAQAFHRQMHRRAIQAIHDAKSAGAISAWVLEQFVCKEIGLVEIGQVFGHKNRNSASRVALDKLRPALNVLCKEWGVI